MRTLCFGNLPGCVCREVWHTNALRMIETAMDKDYTADDKRVPAFLKLVEEVQAYETEFVRWEKT